VAIALSSNSQSATVWALGKDGHVRVREEMPQDEYGYHEVRIRYRPRWVDIGPAGGRAVQIGTGNELGFGSFFPWGNGCVLHPRGNVTCKYGFPVEWGSRRAWDHAYKHGCALLSDGAVSCWGYNLFGQAPRTLRLSAQPKELAVGLDHGCALLRNGRVACWGANPRGDMGPPLTPCEAKYLSTSGDAKGCSYTRCDSVPHLVPELRDVVHVRASGATTCAVLRNGTLVCWDTVPDWWDQCDLHPG
jgi:hypothetical protein